MILLNLKKIVKHFNAISNIKNEKKATTKTKEQQQQQYIIPTR
jgi:hypothetical protein